MTIEDTLLFAGIKPDPTKDQFFLTDDSLIDRIVELGELTNDDVVIEVGAGVGNLTQKLAEKPGKVIAFEVDPRFKPLLDKLPSNVELHFDNAWEYVQLHGKFRKKKEYNKIISNLPYSFSEQFLHNLTFLEYDKAILLIPISLARVIKSHPIFSSFFEVVECFKVPAAKFYPKPKTGSVVIELKKLPDAIESKNLSLFLRQYIYQREEQKVKNSLREGIIDFAKLALDKQVTKKQATEIIQNSNISQELLERTPGGPEIYEEISTKFHANLLKS